MSAPIAKTFSEALAQRFQRFAEVECRGVSALYDHLAGSIAADGELLALTTHAPPGQPVPNLLLAAVHFLLLKGQVDPLAQFYPNLTLAAASPDASYPAFRAFCLAHADAIRHLLATRRVQTNEVGRCAYLMPAFTLVATLAHEHPLALIEIGTSAGLNLQWDRYSYRYGPGGLYGDARSSVQIVCALRGPTRPPLPDRLPAIAARVGVDLHVIDVDDADEALWLRALVWPEHLERARLLHNAMEITRLNPPTLLSGDGLTLLPEVLRTVPADVPVCVFHTHTLNQWSLEARDRFSRMLAEHGATRELYRLSAEGIDTPYPRLELTAWRHGQAHQRLLAYCEHHGRWLEWLDRAG
ncbi:MAG TPA: DUF2332 domain-containing protein [Candidatus Tectomicrobia bacterium]|nr:DUF2332 domain-containing protein [Candidatus Tectomicrobia bacterium]